MKGDLCISGDGKFYKSGSAAEQRKMSEAESTERQKARVLNEHYEEIINKASVDESNKEKQRQKLLDKRTKRAATAQRRKERMNRDEATAAAAAAAAESERKRQEEYNRAMTRHDRGGPGSQGPGSKTARPRVRTEGRGPQQTLKRVQTARPPMNRKQEGRMNSLAGAENSMTSRTAHYGGKKTRVKRRRTKKSRKHKSHKQKSRRKKKGSTKKR